MLFQSQQPGLTFSANQPLVKPVCSFTGGFIQSPFTPTIIPSPYELESMQFQMQNFIFAYIKEDWAVIQYMKWNNIV